MNHDQIREQWLEIRRHNDPSMEVVHFVDRLLDGLFCWHEPEAPENTPVLVVLARSPSPPGETETVIAHGTRRGSTVVTDDRSFDLGEWRVLHWTTLWDLLCHSRRVRAHPLS